MADPRADLENAATATDDTGIPALTSGTNGVPKTTMHFHSDVMAM